MELRHIMRFIMSILFPVFSRYMSMTETPISYSTNRDQCIFLYIHTPEISVYPMVPNSNHALYIYNESMAPCKVSVVWWEKGSVWLLRDIRGGSARKAIMCCSHNQEDL